MRKRFFAVMAAALVVSGMPVMAKETSTEEKISGAVEETKDSTEAESVVSGNEDRFRRLRSRIHDFGEANCSVERRTKAVARVQCYRNRRCNLSG